MAQALATAEVSGPPVVMADTQDNPGAGGDSDTTGMLRALIEVNYQGVVAFEYEKTAGNPVTGLAESVGYVRGLLAGMS